MNPTGVEYYAETNLVNKEEFYQDETGNVKPIYEEIIYDSMNRRTKYKIKDFKGNHNYFICSYNGKFSRIVRLDKATNFIFRPSPWKQKWYRDSVLYLYTSESDYLKDLLNIDTERFFESYTYMIHGSDCLHLGKFIQYINKPLGKEIVAEVRKRQFTGRF